VVESVVAAVSVLGALYVHVVVALVLRIHPRRTPKQFALVGVRPARPLVAKRLQK